MSISLPPALSALLVHEQAELGPLTTLGVGGPAPWVIEPRRREELVLAVKELSSAAIPFRMLGHGSNVLVSDTGVPEVVIHTRSLRHVYHDGEREHALRCEAGATLARLVSVAHDEGLSGAEGLIGIPGTIGGAVAGNAGSSQRWISDVLLEVSVAEPDGSVIAVPCRGDAFGYRRSPFAGRIIVDAVVQLEPAASAVIMERMTSALRAKSGSQPLRAASAGCVFRNTSDHPSGRLIEDAGCKGLVVGGARVSPKHANFIVNEGGATAADVEAVIRRVRDRVQDAHGVALDLEVERWGTFDTP